MTEDELGQRTEASSLRYRVSELPVDGEVTYDQWRGARRATDC